MWQRYNQGTHIFEKSLDNGASWVPMPINASILEGTIPPSSIGGAVAFTDRQQTFAHRQVIQPASGDSPTPYYALELQGGGPTGGDHAGLIFNSWNMGADQKKWRIITNAGLLRFEPVSDSEGTTTGPNSYFDRAANFRCGGSLSAIGNLQTGSPIYPGQEDAGWAIQGSWWLGSHSAYGLRSNTGLYLSGSLWVVGATSCAAISCASINTNGYGVTTGALSITGSAYFACNIWHYSAESWERLHFTWGGSTYLKGPEIRFRNNANTDIAIFDANGGLTVSGSFRAVGNIGTDTNTWRSNLHSTGFVYPGDGSGAQVSWYIQGHGAYGLYCNTGFYVQGNVWSVAGFSSSTYYFGNYHNAYIGRWVGNCDNGNFPGTSGNGATNSGWLRVYDGGGSAIHIPYWY